MASAMIRTGGSSPQVRGPLGSALDEHGHGRLIPAGAGTTRLKNRSKSKTRAHPRRCGDHETLTLDTSRQRGSSPQVRGPLFRGFYVESWGGSSPQVRGPLNFQACGTASVRLIPAGAGTTTCKLPKSRLPRAHPRRCGDHTTDSTAYLHRQGSSPQVRGPPVSTNACAWSMGSSPQVRGPLGLAVGAIIGIGLIPAGAGTTSSP